MIYINNTVAIKDIRDPKLDIAFHPANASG
jgi:hypothetical protein